MQEAETRINPSPARPPFDHQVIGLDANPDAELVALSAEFHAAQIEMDAMDPDAFYDGDPQIARECDLVDRVLYILTEMAELTPKTPEGFRAKAAVILTDCRGQDNPENEYYDPHSALAMSLSRDVLAGAGA